MDAFGKIVEIIVTVVLLFLVPFQYLETRKDMMVQNYITTETTYFVDSARNLGYISRNMYETYRKKLGETQKVVDVELEHYRLVKVLDEKKSLEQYEDVYENSYQQEGTKEILAELYEGSGTYDMHQGDFLKVKVKNAGAGRNGRVLTALFGMDVEFAGCEYGGMIRDEAY